MRYKLERSFYKPTSVFTGTCSRCSKRSIARVAEALTNFLARFDWYLSLSLSLPVGGSRLIVVRATKSSCRKFKNVDAANANDDRVPRYTLICRGKSIRVDYERLYLFILPRDRAIAQLASFFFLLRSCREVVHAFHATHVALETEAGGISLRAVKLYLMPVAPPTR